MKIKTTRLEIFSDGVIAIMITIMVLELKLPGISPSSTTADIIAQLKHLMPHLLTYAFSFMMIGIFWTNHHHMFHMMEKTDEQLLWMNFAFLFFLSLIPFATNLVGANPLHAISAAVYGIVMLMTSLSFLIMRVYTFRKKLLRRRESQCPFGDQKCY